MGFFEFIAIGVFAAVIFLIIKCQNDGAKKVAEKVKEIENDNFEHELLQSIPQMKQSLTKSSVRNATELRKLEPAELMELLSCASSILAVFERRIARIDEGFQMYENNLNDVFSSSKTKQLREKEVRPLKERLEKQCERAADVFEQNLLGAEGVLGVIPESYRMSIILDTMIQYLADGEVGSWEGCIKTFKDDVHKLNIEEGFNNLTNQLNRIERNTKVAVFFSGLAAWNSARR